MSRFEKKVEKSLGKSILALVLVLAMVFSFVACGNAGKDDPKESEDPTESLNPDAPKPPAVSSKPSDDPGAEVTDPPVETASPSPEVTGPDIPLRDTPADDDFFADAAFMGNSLMNGFELYSGLITPDYYTATSMSVVGATDNKVITLDNGNSGTMVDALTQKLYGKIYILLGINEIGMSVTAFTDAYGAMLDTIRATQLDCDIYIMGISPVSAAKSSGSSIFNMTKIGEYNTALYNLAADKGCYYMDLVDALADDTGFLPASETTDGVHFSVKIYEIWLEYVRTHYI